MKSKEIWTIEYCKRQDQFHVDRLGKMLKENLKDLLGGKTLEWIIVGVAPTSEKALQLAEKIRKRIGPRNTKHPDLKDATEDA